MRQQVFGMAKVQICRGGVVGAGSSGDEAGKVDGVFVEKASFLGLRLTGSRLRLGNFNLVLDKGFSGISVWPRVWNVPGFEGACGLGPRGLLSGDGFKLIQSKSGGLSWKQGCGPGSSDPLFSSSPLSLLSNGGLEEQEESDCDAQAEEAETSSPEAIQLVEEVWGVASIIQLEVRGSVEDGVSLATELCREVTRRRAPSTSIAAAAVTYYEHLYSETRRQRPFSCRVISRFLGSSCEEVLLRMVSDEEVWDVVRSCDGQKAHGPDGFPMAFFKKNWE
ncbi:hypothetical protein LINPERHAP2_LOCUS20085 [Linum perenne]